MISKQASIIAWTCFLVALVQPSLAENLSFDYGIFGTEACDEPLDLGIENPIQMQSDKCNAWFRIDNQGMEVANSMQVIRASSRCICFQQTPDKDDCSLAGTFRIKESCVDTCVKDAQGTFLHLSSLIGYDASVSVSDEEYFCDTTGMWDDVSRPNEDSESDQPHEPEPTEDSETDEPHEPEPTENLSFDYGIFGTEVCDEPLDLGIENPIQMQSDKCNAWFRIDYQGMEVANSMQVIRASSRCICFQQTPDKDDCSLAGTFRIKESCVDTCVKDAQGTFLHLSSLTGYDASVSVSDEEYFCDTTGMWDDVSRPNEDSESDQPHEPEPTEDTETDQPHEPEPTEYKYNLMMLWILLPLCVAVVGGLVWLCFFRTPVSEQDKAQQNPQEELVATV